MKMFHHVAYRRTPLHYRSAPKAEIKLNSNEADAVAFLEKYNDEYAVLLNEYVIASWNYETNITDENLNVLVPFHLNLFGFIYFEFICNCFRVKLEVESVCTATRPSSRRLSSTQQTFPPTSNVS